MGMSAPSLHERLSEWANKNNVDLNVDEIDDILGMVAEALRQEHNKFRTYNPISLIEWLEKQ